MIRRILTRFAFAHASELRLHVTRNPIAAVGVALAAGLVAGTNAYTSRLVRRETIEAAFALVGAALFSMARDAAVRSARDWMHQRTVH